MAWNISFILAIYAALLIPSDVDAFLTPPLSSSLLPSSLLSSSGLTSSPKLPSSLFSSPGLTSDPVIAAAETKYNVDLAKAAELFTVTVSANDSIDRPAGTPFLDSKDKEYFVDDIEVVVERVGGLGLELTELAGGRPDGLGITIIENVVEGSNAAAAGIIPGDSLSFISPIIKDKIGLTESTSDQANAKVCECRDFDNTMDVLTSLPPAEDLPKVVVGLKRMRRWPKVKTTVEYPSCQVAEGADPTVEVTLFAGENLKRALQTRGIVFEDGEQRKCDFCGQKCMVMVKNGQKLLSPMSTTEEKLMERNPRCRVSCKTVVGYGMQEGDLDLKVNVMLK